MKNNIALYNLIISIVIAASGCGGALHSEWSGPRGSGHANPFSASYTADSAFERCRAERREQRRQLLCDAGILSGASCDASEAGGDPRQLTREYCAAALAAHAEGGLDPAASDEVVASAPPPPPPSVTDPFIMRILMSNPSLWQDDHLLCMNATSSYGVPGSGGVYSGGYGFGGTSGMYLPAGAVVGTGPAPIVPVITAR